MNIKATIERMRRVLMVANKPDKEEFLQSAKITGIGFLVLGIIGFILFLAIQVLTGGTGL